MTAAESVALAGKMWLYEDDTRTYLGRGDFPARTSVDTLEKTNKDWSATPQCAVRTSPPGGWTWPTGWFDDPRMWAEMKQLAALDEPLLAHPRPFRPEVAAVIDQRSMMRLAYGSPVIPRPGIYEVRVRWDAWAPRTASILKTTCLSVKSRRSFTCCCRPGV